METVYIAETRFCITGGVMHFVRDLQSFFTEPAIRERKHMGIRLQLRWPCFDTPPSMLEKVEVIMGGE